MIWFLIGCGNFVEKQWLALKSHDQTIINKLVQEGTLILTQDMACSVSALQQQASRVMVVWCLRMLPSILATTRCYVVLKSDPTFSSTFGQQGSVEWQFWVPLWCSLWQHWEGVCCWLLQDLHGWWTAVEDVLKLWWWKGRTEVSFWYCHWSQWCHWQRQSSHLCVHVWGPVCHIIWQGTWEV